MRGAPNVVILRSEIPTAPKSVSEMLTPGRVIPNERISTWSSNSDGGPPGGSLRLLVEVFITSVLAKTTDFLNTRMKCPKGLITTTESSGLGQHGESNSVDCRAKSVSFSDSLVRLSYSRKLQEKEGPGGSLSLQLTSKINIDTKYGRGKQGVLYQNGKTIKRIGRRAREASCDLDSCRT